MKYLKKYNESVEEKSMEDIRDICLELEDEGFKVEFKHEHFDSIRISKPNKTFKYEEVKEVMLHLKDYLSHWYIRADVRSTIMSHTCYFNEVSLKGVYSGGDLTNIPLLAISIIHRSFKNKN